MTAKEKPATLDGWRDLARRQDARLTEVYAAIDGAVAELMIRDIGDGSLADVIARLKTARTKR